MEIETETFRALSCHGESLIELKLDRLSLAAIRRLSLLNGCRNLVSLSLSQNWLYELGIVRSDFFRETVAWLKECSKLRIFVCLNIHDLTTLFLSTKSLHLTSLEYEGACPVIGQNRGIYVRFHRALAKQTSLQKLYLKGGVIKSGVDIDGLVNSLSKLVNLKDLRLEGISARFVDQHVVQLASSLLKLEVWSTCGYGLTDAVWGEFVSLRSLRRLELDNPTSLTADGILGFIEKLRPGNKGLILSMTTADLNSDLSREEQELIQEIIAKTVEGTFNFTSVDEGNY